MRKMRSFREVSILLPFVATFPAQNLSSSSLNSRPTKGQKAQNGNIDFSETEAGRRRAVQGLATITWVFSVSLQR